MTNRLSAIAKIAAAGAAFAAMGALAGSAAASGSRMAVMTGSGEATISGARLTVDKVYYFYFANNGRTSFSVQTEVGAIGFSGEVDAQPEPHLYTLTVDSIVRTKAGKDADRQDAEGKCELRYGDRQTDVKSITCNATLAATGAKVLLRFDGDGAPARLNAIPDGPEAPAAQ